MRFRMAISILAASALALVSMASFAGQGQGPGGGANADRTQQADRDRAYDRDRMLDRDQDRDKERDGDRDQDRDQDRIHLQDPSSIGDRDIYGGDLMTDAERTHYRNEMGKTESVQAREQFQMQHEKKMQERALKQGKDLVPPGQGAVYGGELMSVQERNQYREQLRLIDSEQDSVKFQAQHREKMMERAKALDLEIEEAE